MGPFVGGIMVVTWGYSVMYALAGSLLIMSIVPLLWMQPHTHQNGVSWRGFWYFIRDKRYFHDAAANFAVAVHDYSLTIIWPLTLFVRGIHERTLGMVFSVVAIVAMMVQYVSGRMFDKLRRRGGMADEAVFGVSAVGMSLTWIARAVITTLRQVVITDVLGGLVYTIFGGFISDYFHLGGKRMGSIAYWVYMEMVYSLGAIMIFVLMGLGIWYGIWTTVVVLSAATWSLVAIVAARESNLK